MGPSFELGLVFLSRHKVADFYNEFSERFVPYHFTRFYTGLSVLIIIRKEVEKSIETGQKRLERTIDISAQSLDYEPLDSIWMVSTRDTPTVDRFLIIV